MEWGVKINRDNLRIVCWPRMRHSLGARERRAPLLNLLDVGVMRCQAHSSICRGVVKSFLLKKTIVDIAQNVSRQIWVVVIELRGQPAHHLVAVASGMSHPSLPVSGLSLVVQVASRYARRRAPSCSFPNIAVRIASVAVLNPADALHPIASRHTDATFETTPPILASSSVGSV